MVEGKRRSRTLRRIRVRTPGGRNIMQYKLRKPSRAHCACCGSLLHGMKAVHHRALKAMPKTAKRPERPYGGMLCSGCMRRTIIEHIKR